MKEIKSVTPIQPTFKHNVFLCMQTLTNFPFIEDDFDAITNYELLCKVVEYLNKVIENDNKQNESILALYNAFIELKDYIDNLDIKELVDEKLDEMVADGTLLELINENINNDLEFNFISSINTYVDDSDRYLGNCIVFKNKDKVGIIDLGLEPNCYYLIQFLNQNSITKIDYLIISHYHGDHIGGQGATGLDALLDTDIDFSECTAYLPHKNIDYTLFNGTEKTQIQTNETQVKLLLENKGITIVEPSNRDEVVINDDTKFQFLNIGDTFYQQYYNVTTAWTLAETANTNYNNFSMVVLLTHFNNKFLITGDIEEKAESLLYEYFKGIDVLQVEHHSLNRASDKNYLSQLNPQISVICDIDPVNPNLLVNNTTFNSYSKGSKVFHTRYENIKVVSSYTKVYCDNNQMKVVEVTNNISGGMNIEDNTDLDDIIVQGSYFALTGAAAATFTNCPYMLSGFKLYVEKLTGANWTLKQTLVPVNNVNNITYIRGYADGAWQKWEVLQAGPVVGTLQASNWTVSENVTVTAASTSITFINDIIIGNFEFTTTAAITHGTDIFVIPGNITMGNANCNPVYRSETTNFSLVDGSANEYSGYVGVVTSDNTLHVRARKDIPANSVMHGSFVKAPKLRDLSLTE